MQHHSNTVRHRSKLISDAARAVRTKGVRYWISEGFGIPEESAARRESEEAYLQMGPFSWKGSHGTLYVGTKGKTTAQHLRREIPSGTLRAMIDQLELEPKDFGLS